MRTASAMWNLHERDHSIGEPSGRGSPRSEDQEYCHHAPRPAPSGAVNVKKLVPLTSSLYMKSILTCNGSC